MKYLDFIFRHARIFFLLFVILPIVGGIAAYMAMPKEGNPEITVPIAIIATPFPGASPEEVEKLVTDPLEEAIEDITDIKEMRSSSSEGISLIVTEFELDTDIDLMIQKVKEKVMDKRQELPEEVEESIVQEIDYSEIPLLLISVRGDISPIELKDIAEDIADELKAMPEVLDTTISGGLTREVQVKADPFKLNHYHLSLLDLVLAIHNHQVNIPSGQLKVGNRRYLVRTFTEAKKIKDLSIIPISNVNGEVLYLRDVAKVVEGYKEDRTYSRLNGLPSVTIAVIKRPGANILKTSNLVKKKLKYLSKRLPKGVSTSIIADQAKFIRQDFDMMTNSAVWGLLLVVIVLYFAMGFRNAVLTSIALPLSLLMTFLFLYVFGLPNNSVIRFSLILCIGMLVDNAIVVVENVYHHIQRGRSKEEAIQIGMKEIALPVTSATLTTVSAFLPVLLMSGVMGKWMGYMPKTVSIALLSSLIVALVSNPLILSRLMSRTGKGGKLLSPEEDLRRTKYLYKKVATFSLNHPFIIFIGSILLLASCAIPFYFKIVQIEMFPDADFDYAYIIVETPFGTRIERTDEVVRQVEKIVTEKVPEMVQMVANIGSRGMSAYEVTFQKGSNSNFAEITVELLDAKEYKRPHLKEIQARLRPYLLNIPGARVRFRPVEWGPPKEAPIVIKIMGPDIEVLHNITRKVVRELKEIEGVVEIKDDFSDATPELRVHVDRIKAAQLGVSLKDLALTIRTAIEGIEVAEYRGKKQEEDQKILVRLDRPFRSSIEDLKLLHVRSNNGKLIPISQLIDTELTEGLRTIRHYDRRRTVKITANNQGRSAVEITKELKERLKEFRLPPGYKFDFSGDVKETEEAFESLKLAYVIAFLLIYGILVSQFNSFSHPIAIIIALPLSIIGAVLGLVLTKNNFSIMSFIGLVGLSGIVVNDSIVLVDWINRLRRSENMGIWSAIIRGGQERLRPIISTTLTTIGGLITLTVTDELWEGLGVVIIFGLGFATLLTLIVVPVIYFLLERFTTQFKEESISKETYSKIIFSMRPYTRRFIRLKSSLFGILQGAVLAIGMKFWILPLIQERMTEEILAPSKFKWFLEAGVKYMITAFTFIGIIGILLIPLWIFILYVKWLQAKEKNEILVEDNGIHIIMPLEPLFLSWKDIDKIKIRIRSRSLLIWSEGRRLFLKGLTSIKKSPKVPIHKWLFIPSIKSTQKEKDKAFLLKILEYWKKAQ